MHQFASAGAFGSKSTHLRDWTCFGRGRSTLSPRTSDHAGDLGGAEGVASVHEYDADLGFGGLSIGGRHCCAVNAVDGPTSGIAVCQSGPVKHAPEISQPKEEAAIERRISVCGRRRPHGPRLTASRSGVHGNGIATDPQVQSGA